MIPPSVTVHAARVPFAAMRQRGAMDSTIALEAVRAMAEPPGVDAAVELLALAPLQVIGFGFTSSSYVIGREGEIEMCARLSDVAVGCRSSQRARRCAMPHGRSALSECSSSAHHGSMHNWLNSGRSISRASGWTSWAPVRPICRAISTLSRRAAPLLADGEHPGRGRRRHHRRQRLPGCRRHRTPGTRPRPPCGHSEPSPAVGMLRDERILATDRRIRTTLRLIASQRDSNSLVRRAPVNAPHPAAKVALWSEPCRPHPAARSDEDDERNEMPIGRAADRLPSVVRYWSSVPSAGSENRPGGGRCTSGVAAPQRVSLNWRAISRQMGRRSKASG